MTWLRNVNKHIRMRSLRINSKKAHAYVFKYCNGSDKDWKGNTVVKQFYKTSGFFRKDLYNINERFSSGHLKTSQAIGKINAIPGANMFICVSFGKADVWHQSFFVTAIIETINEISRI